MLIVSTYFCWKALVLFSHFELKVQPKILQFKLFHMNQD